MIQLYNTLTRQKEPLKPIHSGEVRMYSCGPTVYWFTHIGNLRAFTFADLLHRLFMRHGLKVTAIMNITDVGHLVGDLDDGEDKMIVAMRREGKTAYDIARFYEDAFKRDLARIGVLPCDAYPRATEHITEQIAMIQDIEKNGLTYRTDDGIYFDTSKAKDYGRLSGQKSEDKMAGARIEMGQKRSVTDFALWKFAPVGEKREMEWESPWGVGFPGWHIECSAMSKKYLGVPFDVHTGGVDHIAVHHENEIAQTMGAEGKLEANVWMHGEFLTMNGGKMSKSLGNLFTLADLDAKGFDPMALRYLFLGAHYRTKLNFTFEALEGAHNALKRLQELARSWPKGGEVEPGYERAFDAALDDDLNTSKALAVLWKTVEDADIPPADKAATILNFDKVFGLGLDAYIGRATDVPAEVKKLMDERIAARKAKDWVKSDELRDAILALGFVVEDGPKGQAVKGK